MTNPYTVARKLLKKVYPDMAELIDASDREALITMLVLLEEHIKKLKKLLRNK